MLYMDFWNNTPLPWKIFPNLDADSLPEQEAPYRVGRDGGHRSLVETNHVCDVKCVPDGIVTSEDLANAEMIVEMSEFYCILQNLLDDHKKPILGQLDSGQLTISTISDIIGGEDIHHWPN